MIALSVSVRAEPISALTAGVIVLSWFGQLVVAAAIATASYLISRFAAAKPKAGEASRQDIRVTSSREGEGLPRIYGTFAVGVKIIDRGSVSAALESTAVGSGKRRQTSFQYRYSCSVAAVVCENFNGTILGISKVWFDNVLKYSRDPSTLDGTNPPMLGYPGSRIHPPEWGHSEAFQILLGQETQTERCDFFTSGSDDDVPGYRGVVTLWWHDMDLTPFYNRIPQIMVEVVSSQNTFQELATQEAALAGVAASDLQFIDPAALNEAMPLGLFTDGPTPAKQLFESLDLLSPFAVADVDGKLKFFPLPQTSSVTISDGELGAINAGRDEQGQQETKFAMSSEQSVEIPQRVEYTWFDPTKNYEQATVGYSRQYGAAVGTKQYFLPFSDVIERMETAASQLVARFQTERDALKVSLPPSYIRYHPGSTLTVPAPNGQVVDMRVVNMEFVPGQMMQVEGFRQINLQGIGAPSLSTPIDVTPTTPDTYIQTVSVFSNCPPLIDDHDGYDGMYWGAGPAYESLTVPKSIWPGATLMRNASGSDDTHRTYEPMASSSAVAVIGRAKTVLANGSGIDATNVVDVEFPYGLGTDIIVGALDDAFTKTTTTNLCILGKEVLQFRDIDDVSDVYGFDADSGQVWRLSQLKRGLRDTATLTTTHAVDEPFLLWNPAAVIRVPVNIDEHPQLFSYKALTKGLNESEIWNPAFISVNPDVPFGMLHVHEGETKISG